MRFIFHKFISSWAFETKFCSVNIAPLGFPVVPEVYKSAAKSLYVLFDGSKKLSRFSKPSVISPTPFAFKDKILQPISSQIGFKLSISDLSTLFTLKRYDAVVHLAARKAAGDSMLEPAMFASNNIIGGQNVINACSDYKIKIIIFLHGKH